MNRDREINIDNNNSWDFQDDLISANMALDVGDDKCAKNCETMDMVVSNNIPAVGDKELTNCGDLTSNYYQSGNYR